MKPKPKDSLVPKIFQSPAAAAAAASVTAAYALTKAEKLDFKELDDINFKPNANNHPIVDVTVEIESIKKEKQVLESSLADVRAENSKIRGEIDEVNSTHTELSKVSSKTFMWCYTVVQLVIIVLLIIKCFSRNSSQSRDNLWLRDQDVLPWRYKSNFQLLK